MRQYWASRGHKRHVGRLSVDTGTQPVRLVDQWNCSARRPLVVLELKQMQLSAVWNAACRMTVGDRRVTHARTLAGRPLRCGTSTLHRRNDQTSAISANSASSGTSPHNQLRAVTTLAAASREPFPRRAETYWGRLRVGRSVRPPTGPAVNTAALA